MAWDELIRNGLTLCAAGAIIESIRYSKVGKGPSYTRILLYTKNGTFWWYESLDDHEKVGSYIIEETLKNFTFLIKHKKKWVAEFNSLLDYISNLRTKDYEKLENKGLADAYNALYYRFAKFHGISFDTDAIDTVLNSLIDFELRKTLKEKFGFFKESVFSDYYNLLTTPNELSYVKREEIEMLEIIQQLQKSKIKLLSLESEKFARLGSNIGKKRTSFLEKFYWTSFGWILQEEKSNTELLQELKRVSKEKPDIEASLKELRNYSRTVETRKKTALSEINASVRLKELLQIFEEYAILHDFRKEGQMKSKHELQTLIREVSRRKKIKPELLEMCWPREIIDLLLENNFDSKLAKSRVNEYLIDFDLENCYEFYGKEALAKKKEYVEISVDENLKDIQGITASSGKVTGKVRIAYSAKEALAKIEEGDILVTGMTTPDFVPAMKKAVGVITDEGGVTCHAAIISREFGIPCIVGTKIATRTLKDGQLVELNADHAVVRVLKH